MRNTYIWDSQRNTFHFPDTWEEVSPWRFPSWSWLSRPPVSPGSASCSSPGCRTSGPPGRRSCTRSTPSRGAASTGRQGTVGSLNIQCSGQVRSGQVTACYQLTVNPSFLVELEASSDPVFAVFSRESDAQGEGRVGDVVVEVVLLPHRHSLHVVQVDLHLQAGHPLLLVHHVLPHLEEQNDQNLITRIIMIVYHVEIRVVVSRLVVFGVVGQLHLGQINAVVVWLQNLLELQWWPILTVWFHQFLWKYLDWTWQSNFYENIQCDFLLATPWVKNKK